jgi:hypothetical protein
MLINHVTKIIDKHGFNPKSAINLVATCRDELCRPFTQKLDAVWGNSTYISSLAGLCFCGKTGFKTAMSSAPIVGGIERCVIWAASHIGLDSAGEVGRVNRPGRIAASSACSSLLAFHSDLKRGRLQVTLDPNDIEQSLLRQQLSKSLRFDQVPTLVELTYHAYECIISEIRKLIAVSTNPLKCEFVIIAGVQVHGPHGQDFFWPGEKTRTGAERKRVYQRGKRRKREKARGE